MSEQDIIMKLAGNIFTLYEVNPYTGEFLAHYRKLSAPESDIRRSMSTEECLYDNVENDVERLLHAEDQDKCRRFFSRESLVDVFESGKSVTAELRFMNGNIPVWFRFMVQSVPGSSVPKLIVACRNVDAEKRVEKLEADRLVEAVLQEKVGRSDYEDDGFEALFDVALPDGDYKAYFKEQGFFAELKSRVGTGEFFADIWQYVGKAVHPQDREKLRRILNKESVSEALQQEKHADWFCRLFLDGRPCWLRLSAVYKDETKKAFIIGIFRAEREVTEQKRSDHLRERLVSKLMGGESLYIVDIRTDEYRTLHRNRYLSERYGMEESFSESVGKYINSDVNPLDRERMLRETEVSYLLERLENEDEVTAIYRDISSGRSRWYRMRATMLSDTELLFGFDDCDDEYIKQIIHQRFAADYFAAFVADMEAGLVKVVKNSPWYEIAEVGKAVPYDVWLRDLADSFDGETERFFLQLIDVDYVNAELEDEDKLAFTYKSPLVAGGSWVRVEIMVLSRLGDGTPGLLVFGFRRLDSLGSEKQELQVDLNKALDTVRAEKSRYDALHDLIHSSSWTVALNDKDEITGFDFSDRMKRVIDNDFVRETADWVRLVHPEDRERVTAAFWAAARDHSGRTSFDATYRMLERGGGYGWFRSAGQIARQADGRGEMFGFHVNITDRIERERKEQHERAVAAQTEAVFQKLLNKFEAVFRLDLKSNSFETLKTDEYIAAKLPGNGRADEFVGLFVPGVVFAPDRERVEKELRYNILHRQVMEEVFDSFTIEYRALSGGIVHWNELQVIFIDEDTIVIGISFNSQEILLKNLSREENGDYFALYAVDIDSGQLRIVKQPPWDNSRKEGETVSYEAAMDKLISRHDGEPVKFYRRLRNLDYVQEWFANDEEKFSYSYQADCGGEKKWITVTARVIIRHAGGSPSVFMLSYAFMDVLASDSFALQQRLKEDMETIGGLAGGYLALYYINIDDNTFRIYSFDEGRLPDTKRLLQEKIGWDTLRRFAASEAVYPDDRRLFADLDGDSIRARLRHRKKFTVRFRRKFFGRYLWSEMDVVKCEGADERANAIIIGFAERDAEIRSEKAHEENFARRVAISDYIIKSFQAAYYCNFANNTMTTLNLADEVKHARKADSYSAFVANCVADDLRKEDRERLRTFLSPQNLKNGLAEEEALNLDFVAISQEEPLMIRCTAIRGEDENHIFLAFRNVTAEVRRQQKEADQLKRAGEIRRLVERVMKNNRATFMVNAVNDTYHSLRTQRKIVNTFGADPSFTRTFAKYADRVYVADRELFRETVKLDNIRERLEKENDYAISYRSVLDGFTNWFKLQFYRLSRESFVMAISDMTMSVVTKLAQETISQNNYGIYMHDLVTDTAMVIKSSGQYMGDSDRSVQRFSELQTRYIEGLPEKTRLLWQGLGTIEGLRAWLRDEDNRELVYESPYRDNKLVRCAWHVVERVDGEAGTVCMSFAELDEGQAERERLHEQIAEQMEIIGGVASDYTALYHVNLLTGEYRPYMIDDRASEIREFIERNEKFGGMINEFIDSELVLPEYRPRLHGLYPDEAGVRAALRDKKKLMVLFQRLFNGTALWTECSIIKCEEVNEPPCTAVVAFRIVDDEIKHRLEQEKKLAEALQSAEIANKSKTSFLFNMSHDIRTPMNAIKGFTAMAKKYLDDKEKVADYLDKIHVSEEQLLNLINQVLEMSRIESGKIELDNKPLNLRDKHEQLATVLGEQANVNGLEFHHAFSDMRHYEVFADDVRLGQVALNIAGNALKYTPKGGRVDYDLQEKPCNREGFARYSLIVSDTGIGMSEEYLKVLFEPFSREKSSTVSHIQGTGLGMSIVKHIVDLMGGTIEVQSAPGKGSRFEVTVELRLADSSDLIGEKPQEAVDPAVFKGKRVLLVEDNELNREIAKDILEEFDLTVEEANDGDVAVEMVTAAFDRGGYGYYDIVLMDIQMPRLNGYEATKAIRALTVPDGVHLPIVAMTANAFEEDRKNAIAAGMDDHLAKPIEIDKLLQMLARHLG